MTAPYAKVMDEDSSRAGHVKSCLNMGRHKSGKYIGAGQLARMMVAPATALGVDLILFAASPNDSGAQITHHVVGDYTDFEELKKFAELCDVVTFEHELVPLSVIRGLEAAGVRVYPPAHAFVYSQDEAQMREKLNSYPSPLGIS